MNDNEICQSRNAVNVEESSEVGIGTFVLIALIITLIMLVVIMCYKRIVNRSLEAKINQKIQEQTIFSLGQYHVFNEDVQTRKAVDVTKL